MMRFSTGLALGAAMLLIALPPPGRADAQMLAFRSADGTAGSTLKTKRIRADLAREIESWSGTHACESHARARSALKPAFTRWLGAQTVAHPGRKLSAWGYHSGDIWTESRIVDGKRTCSAGFRKLIAYAEFG